MDRSHFWLFLFWSFLAPGLNLFALASIPSYDQALPLQVKDIKASMVKDGYQKEGCRWERFLHSKPPRIDLICGRSKGAADPLLRPPAAKQSEKSLLNRLIRSRSFDEKLNSQGLSSRPHAQEIGYLPDGMIPSSKDREFMERFSDDMLQDVEAQLSEGGKQSSVEKNSRSSSFYEDVSMLLDSVGESSENKIEDLRDEGQAFIKTLQDSKRGREEELSKKGAAPAEPTHRWSVYFIGK